jgi:hypothetical protein
VAVIVREPCQLEPARSMLLEEQPDLAYAGDDLSRHRATALV